MAVFCNYSGAPPPNRGIGQCLIYQANSTDEMLQVMGYAQNTTPI